MARRKKHSGPAFVQIYHWMLASPAWQDLSLGARATYLELKRHYNGKNNGTIGFGSRGAGDALGMSKSAGSRYLVELENHGFIKRNKPSSFNQKRLAIEWCLTELRDDSTSEPASKLFMYWTRELGLKRNTRPLKPGNAKPSIGLTVASDHRSATASKIQKPVPPVDFTVPPAGLPAGLALAGDEVRPTGGTVSPNSSTLQSHRWDTSTSVPDGARAKYVQAVAAKIRVHLSDAHGIVANDDDWWLMPIANAVASKLMADVSEDPLGSLLLSRFPGAVPQLHETHVDSYLKAAVRDGLLPN